MSSLRSFPPRRLSLAAAVTAALAVFTPAAAHAASTSGRSAVATGVTPGVVSNVTVFGSTPPGTPETVSFVLREHNLAGLEWQTETGFGHFLSVSQFAARYGASPATISALTQYLAGFGITTSVYPDDVDVVASGTAGEFDSALDVTQQNYSAPATQNSAGGFGLRAQRFHGTDEAPSLPNLFAHDVVAILGLTNYAPFESSSAHASRALAKASGSVPTSGALSASDCETLSGLPDGCHTPQDFAHEYGLSSLYRHGAIGSGQTVGIVTLAALDVGGPEYFWKHYTTIPQTGRTVTVDNVDGGPGAASDASGSGETDLDVEQSGGVAPGANVIVYQAPNTDSGFADAFFSAASQNTASTVSASWGESESFIEASVAAGTETAGYVAAFDEAFLELAAQGQSGFTSAGDDGAYTASASGDLGTTNLSTDNPADSPYITAAGGTTLPWSGTLTDAKTGLSATVDVPHERIWGWDYLWQPVATIAGESLEASAESQVVGGGGGFSTIESEPVYQYGVAGTSTFSAVPYLTPTDYQTTNGLSFPTAWSFNPAPAVTQGTGSGRAIPDVSTDADPYSGYLLYEPSAVPIGGTALQGGWGGTSYVAPELNGSGAVIDSYLGRRVGFWNPTMYAAARSWGSPLTPLNTSGPGNDNIYYSGTPGTLYNEGAGLGIPNLAALARDF